MNTAFDETTSKLVARILLEAQLDVVTTLAGDSKLGEYFKLLPWASRKSNMSSLAHFASMAYMAMAHSKGMIGGAMEWSHPTAGNDVLEWTVGDKTFKFRRTDDRNENPRKADYVRKCERYNANERFLIEPEPSDLAGKMIHWLICSGFHDGPNLKHLTSSQFFAWTAPFLADNDQMVGSRYDLFQGECHLLMDMHPQADTAGVAIDKPLLNMKEKQSAIEEVLKKAGNGE